MITYVKYPLTEYGFSALKVESKFFVCDKIEKHGKWLVVYPKLKIEKDEKGNDKVIYSTENKVGFYCKTIDEKDILKFKGGFNIEKCSQKEWQVIGKKWYADNKMKLPKKWKKKICGKKK